MERKEIKTKKKLLFILFGRRESGTKGSYSFFFLLFIIYLED